jgi:hypothetical protein
LQSHYNYVFDNITNTYNFTTKNSILYRVAFIVDETFSAISGEEIANIFQLIVEKANEETEPFDAKVSKTIENIIDRFFQRIENSLVYVCSDEDEKAKLRYDVFDRWYKKSEFKENVVKIDNIFNINISKTEIHKLYTSFMFHKNNSNYDKLIEIYSKIEETLNSK